MKRVLLLSILLIASLAFTCTPKAVSPASLAMSEAKVQEKEASNMQPWEAIWNETLAQARKEGKVIIYSTSGAETTNAYSKAFEKSHGLKIEVTAGRGPDITAKVLSERRAGLYIVDLYLGGGTTLGTQIKPAGVIEPLEPWLILPEVLDAGKWWGGRLGWLDQEKKILSFLAYPSGDFAINTTLVKEGEIVSLRDFLNPKWKDKIVLNDPTIAGSGLKMFTIMYNKMGPEYIQELIKQNPQILRDQRLQIEWLARGKYAIAPSPKPEILAEFIRAGAPIKSIIPKEGGYLSSGDGHVVIFKGAPRLAAAKVFSNWLLSREGQQVFSNAALTQSRRIDIDLSHINAEDRRKEGFAYSDVDSETDILEKPKYAAMASEYFKNLMK